MSNRREVLRNWVGTTGVNRPVANLESNRMIFSPEAPIGLFDITKLRSKILSPEEIAIKSTEDIKSEKVVAENIKPDSSVDNIRRVGREDPRRLRRSRRGRCGCTEKPCQRRSCPQRNKTTMLKKAA